MKGANKKGVLRFSTTRWTHAELITSLLETEVCLIFAVLFSMEICLVSHSHRV